MGLFAKNSGVIELSPSNFDKRTKKVMHPLLDNGSKALVFFGTGWCHYCKLASPEFTKAAQALGTSFPIFQFDCEKYKDFALKTLKIDGYPTIKFVDRNGSLYKTYTGERTYPEFLKAICNESSVCKK
jgi:thiol-disulfide isomerase/thioredoxin